MNDTFGTCSHLFPHILNDQCLWHWGLGAPMLKNLANDPVVARKGCEVDAPRNRFVWPL